MTRVLITGAGGFVGQQLCPALEKAGFDVVSVFRAGQRGSEKGARKALYGIVIDAATDWRDELTDVDVVVHLAAKVHVMTGDESDGLATYRAVNVEGTRNLAIQAAQCGVKRFVYLSSIKVNGERTFDKPFNAEQPPEPEDSYATSKMEAEISLRTIEQETGMEVVIIRSPLIYGPGVKGNLEALSRIIKKGVPIPLGALSNRRDLVGISNLCDLISVCCSHSAAAGRTFLVSDGESISTTGLVQLMSNGLDRKARLFAVPDWALNFAARLLGKTEMMEKLTGDLRIDMSVTQRVLDWNPPVTVAEGFRMMNPDE